MTTDKSFFERLGRQIRYAEQARCGAELSTFKTQVYTGAIQWILDTLTFFFIGIFRLRSVARRKAESETKWLAVISEYGPKIKEQFRNYEQAFMDWEYQNRRGGDYGDSMQRENYARNEVNRLTTEAKEKLAKVGYPFRPLTANLITGMEGWISVFNAMVYWDTLLALFSARVDYLVGISKENQNAYRKIKAEKTNSRKVLGPAITTIVYIALGALLPWGIKESACWAVAGIMIAAGTVIAVISKVSVYEMGWIICVISSMSSSDWDIDML